MIGQRGLIWLEILVVLLLEGLLELFGLFVDLITLKGAQPLLIALGETVGELADAVFLQGIRRDLADGHADA